MLCFSHRCFTTSKCGFNEQITQVYYCAPVTEMHVSAKSKESLKLRHATVYRILGRCLLKFNDEHLQNITENQNELPYHLIKVIGSSVKLLRNATELMNKATEIMKGYSREIMCTVNFFQNIQDPNDID